MERLETANTPFDGMAMPLVRQGNERNVLAQEEYQGGPFKVLARKQEIERDRGNNCHNGKPLIASKGRELTHGVFRLSHGREGPGA